jgi:hypothetical protein
MSQMWQRDTDNAIYCLTFSSSTLFRIAVFVFYLIVFKYNCISDTALLNS